MVLRLAAALLALIAVFGPLDRTAAPAGARASASEVAFPAANILCKFPDVAGEPKTKDYVQSMFLNDGPRSLDGLFREASYGAVNFTGTETFGWYPMPNPQSFYSGNIYTRWGALLTDCANAADSDVDFNKFDVVNAWFNAASFGTEGFSFIDGATLTLGGVTKQYRFTVLPSTTFNIPRTVAHELGHAFGMKHISGARWDMTGHQGPCQATDTFGCWGGAPNAHNRDRAGWIPAERTFAYAGGAQQVTLARLTQPGPTGDLMATVPIGSTGTYYSVEVRRKVGYDPTIPGEAVLIWKVTPAASTPSSLVDADGGTLFDGGVMWTPNETYSDAPNGIAIRVDALGECGAVVTINPSGPATTVPPPPSDCGGSSSAPPPAATATPTPVPPAATPTATSTTTTSAAPQTPTNLRTTAQGTDSSIDVAWDAPVTPGVYFEVSIRPLGGRRWTVEDVNESERSYTFDNLQAITSYVIRIRACRGGNSDCSPYSPDLAANTTIANVAPAATATSTATAVATATATPIANVVPAATATPTPNAGAGPAPTATATSQVGGAPAVPTNLHTTAQDSSSVTVAWDAPAGSADSYTLAYQLYNSGQWTEVTVRNALTLKVMSLQPGTWHQFKVKACRGSSCSTFTGDIAVSTTVG